MGCASQRRCSPGPMAVVTQWCSFCRWISLIFKLFLNITLSFSICIREREIWASFLMHPITVYSIAICPYIGHTILCFNIAAIRDAITSIVLTEWNKQWFHDKKFSANITNYMMQQLLWEDSKSWMTLLSRSNLDVDRRRLYWIASLIRNAPAILSHYNVKLCFWSGCK